MKLVRGENGADAGGRRGGTGGKGEIGSAKEKRRRRVMREKKMGEKHVWTGFEEHVILCLLVRGVHRPERGSAHLDYFELTSELNKALFRGQYEQDFAVSEVIEKLHGLMQERKGAIALLNRQLGGRSGRLAAKVWSRGGGMEAVDNDDYFRRLGLISGGKVDFTGTVEEWKAGRREKEMRKVRNQEKRKRGLPEEMDVDNTDAGIPSNSLLIPETAVVRGSGNIRVKTRWLLGVKGDGKKRENGRSLSRSRRDVNSRSPPSPGSRYQRRYSPVKRDGGGDDVGEREKDNNAESFSSLPREIQESPRFCWALTKNRSPNRLASPLVSKSGTLSAEDATRRLG